MFGPAAAAIKEFNTLACSVLRQSRLDSVLSPELERDRRAVLGSDQCIIDDKHFFIRGCLETFILDCKDPFVWGVWVSLSEASFARIGELLETEIRDNEPPFFGWLCNELVRLSVNVRFEDQGSSRNKGVRPFVELEPTDHPLAVEQRKGIRLQRVEEIASMLLRHQ